ncbi:MAG: PLP-dependent transferase, partial [Phenylobacterium sp.]|nr:PLP-dependent transferase [Phenylobacterium sp.]
MTTGSEDDVPAFGENTRLVLGGRAPFDHHGFVNTPVFRGSTVLSPTVKDYVDQTQLYTYGRRGTPTSQAFQEALQAIDHSAGVVLCPSGLAAVSTALLACLSAGDHLLMTDCVYRP